MKNWLAIAGLVVALIQAAVELIKQFEVPGFGLEKKTLVMQMLEKTFEFLRVQFKIDLAWEAIAGLISGAIDAIVGFFNVTGVFKK